MTAVAKPHTPPTQLPKLAAFAAFDEYEGWDEERLRRELAKRLGLSAENLIHAAALWSILERKGCDMSGLKDGYTLYLPHIAVGAVLAELVVGFAPQPDLLKKLSRLTPADQQRMIDGEPVLLVVKPGESRMLPVRVLTPRQITQVIGNGSIRTEREQIAILCDQKPRRVRPGKPAKVGKVRADMGTGLVHIGRNFAPVEDVIAALTAAGLLE
jgi:hypothetical protein